MLCSGGKELGINFRPKQFESAFLSADSQKVSKKYLHIYSTYMQILRTFHFIAGLESDPPETIPLTSLDMDTETHELLPEGLSMAEYASCDDRLQTRASQDEGVTGELQANEDDEEDEYRNDVSDNESINVIDHKTAALYVKELTKFGLKCCPNIVGTLEILEKTFKIPCLNQPCSKRHYLTIGHKNKYTTDG